MTNITNEDILNAQKKWADGLVEIGRSFEVKEDYQAVAEALLNDLYGYQLEHGVVLFKPTKAYEIPFRGTYEGALSYFIGGNEKFPEDKGFALEPWAKIKFYNHNIYFHQEVAIVMGYYVFTSVANTEAKVEYTFGYTKDQYDKLKIILHHSSLPYSIDN